MFLQKLPEHLYLSVTFLTRIPLPSFRRNLDQGLANSAYCFAFVGALIGVLTAYFAWLVQPLGLVNLVLAILLVGFTALLTGALHEDGLADCCDGFGGGHNRDRKLEIMKDSRIGTYGVLALILVTALKIALLSNLLEFNFLEFTFTLAVVHSLSRASMPVTMAIMSPAKTSGLASTAGKVAPILAVLGFGLSLLIIWIVFGLSPMFWAAVITLLVLAGFVWLSHRQIGGFTGDSLGAQQQIIEVALLAFFVSHLGF